MTTKRHDGSCCSRNQGLQRALGPMRCVSMQISLGRLPLYDVVSPPRISFRGRTSLLPLWLSCANWLHRQALQLVMHLEQVEADRRPIHLGFDPSSEARGSAQRESVLQRSKALLHLVADRPDQLVQRRLDRFERLMRVAPLVDEVFQSFALEISPVLFRREALIRQHAIDARGQAAHHLLELLVLRLVGRPRQRRVDEPIFGIGSHIRPVAKEGLVPLPAWLPPVGYGSGRLSCDPARPRPGQSRKTPESPPGPSAPVPTAHPTGDASAPAASA